MTSSIFAAVEMAPRDPILGLNESFNADTRSTKVNLGVGVYFDDNGKIPLLNAVMAAEKKRLESLPARGYLPIEGLGVYNQAVQTLLFGKDSALLAEGRVVSAEALGGTGALKVGADYLKRLLPDAKVYISDPSWENHRALFESAGFTVESYPYYDATTHGVNFDAMKAGLKTLPADSIVVLHACCHNPTGADLTEDQWRETIEVIRARGLVAFIDMAYQGFSDGIAGERVGALSIVTASKDESARVMSQIKRVIRTNYSNPPTHGAAVVAAVLSNPELRQIWEDDLAVMRNRIRTMRGNLVEKLKVKAATRDFSFVIKQRGMFSYTGLSAEQVARLQSEYGIYAVSSGRICLAALNSRNIDYVADAIATVL